MLNDLTNVNNTSYNMENRNCLRRIARHDETEFSNQSIMNTMEKFVKAVNDMDETILVPCRLMDLKVGDDQDTVATKSPHHYRSGIRAMGASDLFKLYNMVNSVKNELLWGQSEDAEEEEPVAAPAATKGMVTVASSASISSAKGHARRPSTASMTSTNSAASISDSDSDNGIENDSGIEGEDAAREPDYPRQVAANFRRHLCGLHRSLRQLTDAADYLTARYQSDVGGAV